MCLVLAMLSFYSTSRKQPVIRKLEICVIVKKVNFNCWSETKEIIGKLPVPANKDQNAGFLTISRILQLSPKEVQMLTSVQLAKLPSEKVWLGIRRDDETLYWMDLYSGRRITYEQWAIKRSTKEVTTKANQTTRVTVNYYKYPRFVNSIYITKMVDNLTYTESI